MSLVDQIKLFQKAKVVIAAHGAALCEFFFFFSWNIMQSEWKITKHLNNNPSSPYHLDASSQVHCHNRIYPEKICHISLLLQVFQLPSLQILVHSYQSKKT